MTPTAGSEAETATIRVVVVDDHQPVRGGSAFENHSLPTDTSDPALGRLATWKCPAWN